ncbi:MAG: hypothetical protein ACREQL_10115 [Candidatus Binatia bacterium]
MRCLAFALVLAAAGCGPGPIVRHGRIDAAALSSVEDGLERVRGLQFTAAVPGRVLDDAGVIRLLDGELDREFLPGDLERLSAVYARLGLFPPDTTLRPLLQQLYADQVAALYDPRTKTLALTSSGLRERPASVRLLELLTGRDLLDEVLVAHELTHALQDQHFGLPTTTPPITDAHGDRTIARRALIEGDATLASVAYLRGGDLDQATLLGFLEEVAGIPEELATRHPDVPQIIRAGLAFQYDQGAVFAAVAYQRGGWPAVDDAHRDPPTSSEQVLHPEKYFGTRDVPIEVTLGGTEELERNGWTRIVEDTLGELDMRVLFRAVTAAGAPGVAAGWGGDRLRALQRRDQVAIVWLTAWDTEADAVEFADAMPQVASGASVERRGDRVLVLLGTTDAALVKRVWRRSRCVRPSDAL